MSFLGFYSEKEVEEIKNKLNKDYKTLRACKEVEINSLNLEKENLLAEIEEINEEHSKIIEDLEKQVKELKKQVFILKNLLHCDADKEINRLERIAKRTKKIRVKKKCESSILDYKMRKMAYGQ
ncbi:hypothetical protein [Romboutsia sp. Marseille-P6047]|uniref:hypothetical protein n=1 Tax=Romboutsia sp. Marseille-P6047 TaxID=2161817 RepID=UPI000F066ABE|nr:hypothetical protein [Romboutsia sp. Marseille-P6047]